jgi:hypothetical protein
MSDTNAPIFALIGETLTRVDRTQGEDGDVLDFTTQSGRKFRMFHSQDCCECVRIEDVCGDLSDLIGAPIIQAEETSGQDAGPKLARDYYTWTFYRLATAKGQVVLRWLGESNGFYSESVDFEEVIE